MSAPQTQPRPDLLTDLLRDVSRSFFLTLRVLPSGVRRPVGLAYLLARATDTIADTALVPVDRRRAALRDLRERIAGSSRRALDFQAFLPGQSSDAERRLLSRVEEGLSLLEHTRREDRALIREVLDVITSGQDLDLERFAGAGPDQLVALKSDAELEDYTWRVAGCVGEFWTKICRRHLFPSVAMDEASLIREGVRFGQGLQLVNILRDLATDLHQGRCYLPSERLGSLGMEPRDLLRPESEGRLRPLYNGYLQYAHEDLAAGWSYTNRLPKSQLRLRLACAWPILIGVQTLRRLREEPVLEVRRRVKISRGEVRAIILRSVLRLPFGAAWRRQFGELPGESPGRVTS